MTGVSIVGGNIAVVGAFTTADVCREVNGAGDLTRNKILITMRAESVDDECEAGLGRFDYQVVVTDAKSGPWAVEIRHLQYGHGMSTLVKLTSVVVP